MLYKMLVSSLHIQPQFIFSNVSSIISLLFASFHSHSLLALQILPILPPPTLGPPTHTLLGLMLLDFRFVLCNPPVSQTNRLLSLWIPQAIIVRELLFISSRRVVAGIQVRNDHRDCANISLLSCDHLERQIWQKVRHFLCLGSYREDPMCIFSNTTTLGLLGERVTGLLLIISEMSYLYLVFFHLLTFQGMNFSNE